MFDKPILVGLTDNHRSDNALRMGRLLAARFGVQLQVVHAVRERDLLTGNVAEGKQAVAEAHLLNAVRATVTGPDPGASCGKVAGTAPAMTGDAKPLAAPHSAWSRMARQAATLRLCWASVSAKAWPPVPSATK